MQMQTQPMYQQVNNQNMQQQNQQQYQQNIQQTQKTQPTQQKSTTSRFKGFMSNVIQTTTTKVNEIKKDIKTTTTSIK